MPYPFAKPCRGAYLSGFLPVSSSTPFCRMFVAKSISQIMKMYPFLLLLIGFQFFSAFQPLWAQSPSVPDSIKATSFLAAIVPGNRTGVKTWAAGITEGAAIRLELYKQKKKHGIGFHFPQGSQVVATGIGVLQGKTSLQLPVNIVATAGYQLMLTMAADSAENFVLYSGYVFLPEVSKWKLIGTSKVAGYVPFLQMSSTFWTGPAKDTTHPDIKEEWVQRTNGSWKSQMPTGSPIPVVNLLSNTDSLTGIDRDVAIIEKAIAEKKIDSLKKANGIYFQVLKEGTGKTIQVSDSVKVNYKGSLFADGSVFDQTKGEPRKFPLQRLIYGWQVGVPLIKEGGKIKLVIPSHLGYSIRTRSPKIPPNSILVFEIEVLETTPMVK